MTNRTVSKYSLIGISFKIIRRHPLTMAFVELKNLNKYYPISGSEDFQALKDVNLSLDKGELVSIVGESGSG